MNFKKDKELNKLTRKRHDLIRKFDNKEISKDEFNSALIELNKEISIKISNVIALERKRIDERLDNNNEGKTMSEETKATEAKKEEAPKEAKKRTVKKDTYAYYAEKALKLKTVKSFDDVYEKVNEWKPGKDKMGVIRIARAVIMEVKKQKSPRWKGYKWDAENFLLISPEE